MARATAQGSVRLCCAARTKSEREQPHKFMLQRIAYAERHDRIAFDHRANLPQNVLKHNWCFFQLIPEPHTIGPTNTATLMMMTPNNHSFSIVETFRITLCRKTKRLCTHLLIRGFSTCNIVESRHIHTCDRTTHSHLLLNPRTR